MQKQTKIKMNDKDSPKLGGGAPTALKLLGQVAPTAPPPVPASLGGRGRVVETAAQRYSADEQLQMNRDGSEISS